MICYQIVRTWVSRRVEKERGDRVADSDDFKRIIIVRVGDDGDSGFS